MLLVLVGVVTDEAVSPAGGGQLGGNVREELASFRALAASPLPGRPAVSVAVRERRAVERVMHRMRFVSAGGSRGRRVALTFDDGPGPFTAQLVRTLRARHVPATFFQVGEMIPAFRSAARDVERHFPVGDHSLSHPQMGLMSERAQRVQVQSTAARLRAVEGARFPTLFRPPYASFNAQTFGVLRRERMLMVLWDVDSEDYTRPGVQRIVRNVVSGVRPGSIVLMHDAGGDRSETVAALPLIVRRLRARGYRFVTVPRMMLKAPPPRRQKLPPGASR